MPVAANVALTGRLQNGIENYLPVASEDAVAS